MNKKQAFKVESGIPMERQPRETKYPFDKMKVTDSFLVPKNGKSPNSIRPAIYAALKNFNKNQKKPIKLSMLTVKEGLRVWRIK